MDICIIFTQAYSVAEKCLYPVNNVFKMLGREQIRPGAKIASVLEMPFFTLATFSSGLDLLTLSSTSMLTDVFRNNNNNNNNNNNDNKALTWAKNSIFPAKSVTVATFFSIILHFQTIIYNKIFTTVLTIPEYKTRFNESKVHDCLMLLPMVTLFGIIAYRATLVPKQEFLPLVHFAFRAVTHDSPTHIYICIYILQGVVTDKSKKKNRKEKNTFSKLMQKDKCIYYLVYLVQHTFDKFGLYRQTQSVQINLVNTGQHGLIFVEFVNIPYW